MMKTWLISAFPGCGKTTASRTLKGQINVIDSDSSTFDKNDFPRNYIEHIKENIGKQDVIFISSHETVRQALEKEGLEYFLFYPALKRKEEFLDLYYHRGNNEAFLRVLDKNFESFIESCQNDSNPNKIELNKEGEFLLTNSIFQKIIEEIKNS